MPPSCCCAESVISSAAFLASRLSSWTVRMTVWPGAADLNWQARVRALANSGRTFTRVLIFSEKIGLQRASFSASSWLASSWVAVEHLAYPDPDRHGALDADRRVVRCRADHPRLAGPAVVGDGDVEIFAKRGHEGEAGRVVL